MHDSLLRRNVNYSELSPQALLVEVCRVLDAWHIVEDAGNNRSKNGAVEWLQETIYGADGEAYCMSTVQSETALVEHFLQKTSNLPASEGCVDTWRQAQKRNLVLLSAMSQQVQPGDIAVWKQFESDSGHTGRVIVARADGTFQCFEGNTSGAKGVEREGGGAFMKERDRQPSGKLYLLGFIRETFA